MFKEQAEQQEKKAEGMKKEALQMVKAQTLVLNDIKKQMDAGLDREENYKHLKNEVLEKGKSIAQL